MSDPQTLYCYLHPDRPTTLRCNRCDRPICVADARRVPTGYRCPDCVKQQQKVFDTAVWYDYVVAFAVAGLLSGLGSFIVTLVSGFFFGLGVIFLAPMAGGVMGNIILQAIHKHRSRELFMTAAGGMIAGALPVMLVLLLGGSLLPLLWQGVYLALAVPAAYTQISGIRIGR